MYDECVWTFLFFHIQLNTRIFWLHFWHVFSGYIRGLFSRPKIRLAQSFIRLKKTCLLEHHKIGYQGRECDFLNVVKSEKLLHIVWFCLDRFSKNHTGFQSWIPTNLSNRIDDHFQDQIWIICSSADIPYGSSINNNKTQISNRL